MESSRIKKGAQVLINTGPLAGNIVTIDSLGDSGVMYSYTGIAASEDFTELHFMQSSLAGKMGKSVPVAPEPEPKQKLRIL